MVEVQIDVIAILADAAAFADLDGHRARDDVARGEVLRMRGIALHEALAVAVGEVAAFATRALRDQHARAVDAGRVELHEFHVLQRQARAQNHRVAVAGAGVRRRAREVGAAIAARRQDGASVRGSGGSCRRPWPEAMTPRQAPSSSIIRSMREVFDEELGRVAQRLAIERVQHGVTRAVGGGAGALRRRACAEFRGHAAERAADRSCRLRCARTARRSARVRYTASGALTAEILDGVLVAQPVGALDGVVHMPAPIVRPHVAERGRNAALGCNRMRARRKYLRDARRLEACFGSAQRGAKPSSTRPTTTTSYV